MKFGKLILFLTVAFLFLVPQARASYGVVLDTDMDQNLDVKIPSFGELVEGNRPVPAFLSIDRISTEEGDEINYVFVCVNEGNQSGNNECAFRAGDRETVCQGNVGEPGGAAVCRGSFSSGTEVSPYASNGTENTLFFKIPEEGLERGLVVIFNGPGMEQKNGEIPIYHPLANQPATRDYGEYTWVLKGLDLKDQQGNRIDTYPVNTKSFLPGEKIMVWKYEAESGGFDLSENGVSNPGFEEGLGGWTLKNGNWTLSDISHSGNQSIYIKSVDNHKELYAYQKISVNPNTVINVSGWVKTKDVEKRSDGNGVYLMAKLVQPNGNINEYTAELDGTRDWKEYNLTVNTRAAVELILHLYHHRSTGEAWFDDLKVREVSNVSRGEIIDVGKYEDTVYELYDGSEIKIEPLLDLEYGEEEGETSWVLVEDDVGVKRSLRIESRSSDRPQPLNLTPGMAFPQDYVEGSCENCFETGIVEPGSSRTLDFSWRERGVEMKLLGIEQNISAESTEEEQHLVKKVIIENAHSSRALSDIEGSVFIEGICENWVESQKKINWGKDWLREESCYLHVDLLNPGESVIKEVGFYGDFLDMEYGEVEQDPTKQSTLDRQYLRRKIVIRPLSSEYNIPMKIKVNVSGIMPCEECDKILITEKKSPALEIDFDEANSALTTAENRSWEEKLVEGESGKVLKLEEGDCLKVENNAFIERSESGDHTIEAWVYALNDGDLANKNGEFWQHLKADGSRAELRTKNRNYKWYKFNKSAPMEQWNHIAYVWDSSKQIFYSYINGEPNGFVEINDSPVTGKQYLSIGSRLCGFSNGLDGYIEEFRLYDSALSHSEIKSLYMRETMKNIYVTSSSTVLEVKLKNAERINYSGNKSMWKREMIVANSADFDFLNVTGLFSLDLHAENFTSEKQKITDLKINGSEVRLLIPFIGRGENTYEIYFETNSTSGGQISIPVTGWVTGIQSTLHNLFIRRDVNESLVLQMTFEEGRGNLTENVAGNATGDMHGNPRWVVGKYGLGIEFEGQEDYIEIVCDSYVRTLSFWIKRSVSVSNSREIPIITKSDECRIYMNEMGEIEAVFGKSRASYAMPKNDAWYHVASTFTDGKTQLYVNGELVVEGKKSDQYVHEGEKIIIGGGVGEDYPFALDEVMAFESELTVGEINSVYNRENSSLLIKNFGYVLMFLTIISALLITYIEQKKQKEKLTFISLIKKKIKKLNRLLLSKE